MDLTDLRALLISRACQDSEPFSILVSQSPWLETARLTVYSILRACPFSGELAEWGGRKDVHRKLQSTCRHHLRDYRPTVPIAELIILTQLVHAFADWYYTEPCSAAIIRRCTSLLLANEAQ